MTGPRTGCSIVCIIPRLCRSGSCMSSSVVIRAPQGTPAPAMIRVTSCLVRFDVHSGIVEQVLAADRLHQTLPMLRVAPRGKDVAQVVEPARRAFIEPARRGAE